ncbi:HdeD family acid-resistance protein [Ancylobacter pratisalsi]|uniref:HdeD family acid-resistance protein n=1 Tax=Ancylobacter pratisalsi TaxID=1745854 RepID=UPI001FE7F4D7|nr:protease [Ancylobacter pratisalsi]
MVGFVFIFMGLGNALRLLDHTHLVARALTFARAIALIAIGAVVIHWPGHSERILAALFCVVFLVDGIGRIGIGLLVHLPDWRSRALYGSVELAFAVLFFTGWPLPLERSIPLCVGLIFALRGWMLIRFSLMFRTLENEAAILSLPIFATRGWYANAPVLVDDQETELVENPLTVHVWTPAGSAAVAQHLPVIDRYVAAIDAKGVISTGHASMEMLPSLYISHYPAVELDRSTADFVTALRGTPENDVEGRFQPSYAYEVGEWCAADAHVEFRNFNPRRLRAFWAGYRQDNTYNLTNRNCSVVVAQALDAALEGSLATRSPWLQLVILLANPDVWIGATLRSRAYLSTWTPGLVLDYARTMARIVEKQDVSWSASLSRFLRRLWQDRAGSTGAAA